MTKAELIERIARSRSLPPDITKKDIAQILGLAFEELANFFAKAKVTRTTSPRFTFPRFGTFTKKRRNARRGVNPRTLEPMQIDACQTVDFKASRELRDAMNPGLEPVDRGEQDQTLSNATSSTQKRTAKTTAKRTTGSRAGSRGRDTEQESVLRCPTPRDEDAELDALIKDDEMFDEMFDDGPALGSRATGAATTADRSSRPAGAELPEAPLKRVRAAPSKSRARTG